MDSNGTIPVQRNEIPSQWSRDDWNVDESWQGWVTEIEGWKVEEVDNQDDLSPDEVWSDKEHDKGELEEIVEDEMASDTCCGVHIGEIGGE